MAPRSSLAHTIFDGLLQYPLIGLTTIGSSSQTNQHLFRNQRSESNPAQFNEQFVRPYESHHSNINIFKDNFSQQSTAQLQPTTNVSQSDQSYNNSTDSDDETEEIIVDVEQVCDTQPNQEHQRYHRQCGHRQSQPNPPYQVAQPFDIDTSNKQNLKNEQLRNTIFASFLSQLSDSSESQALINLLLKNNSALDQKSCHPAAYDRQQNIISSKNSANNLSASSPQQSSYDVIKVGLSGTASIVKNNSTMESMVSGGDVAQSMLSMNLTNGQSSLENPSFASLSSYCSSFHDNQAIPSIDFKNINSLITNNNSFN